MSDAFSPPMSDGSLTQNSGLSGTSQNVTQNVTNGGNQAGPVSVTANAVGDAPGFNANGDFDQGGAVTVGGVNPPTTMDYRTAMASGDGSAGSCMSGAMQNSSIGTGTGPPQAYVGIPPGGISIPWGGPMPPEPWVIYMPWPSDSDVIDQTPPNPYNGPLSSGPRNFSPLLPQPPGDCDSSS